MTWLTRESRFLVVPGLAFLKDKTMFTAILLLGATCFHHPGEQKDKTIEMDLAGVRPAKAFLTVRKDEYLIRVVMTPITVFDKATNDLFNHDKARELALFALAKHLSGKDAADLTVSGAETKKSGEEGKNYSLTLRVPIRGVSLVKATENERQGGTSKSNGADCSQFVLIYSQERL